MPPPLDEPAPGVAHVPCPAFARPSSRAEVGTAFIGPACPEGPQACKPTGQRGLKTRRGKCGGGAGVCGGAPRPREGDRSPGSLLSGPWLPVGL